MRRSARSLRLAPLTVGLLLAAFGATAAAQSLLFDIAGDGHHDRLGTSLACGGDLDGDLATELLVGAREFEPLFLSDPGDATAIAGPAGAGLSAVVVVFLAVDVQLLGFLGSLAASARVSEYFQGVPGSHPPIVRSASSAAQRQPVA